MLTTKPEAVWTLIAVAVVGLVAGRVVLPVSYGIHRSMGAMFGLLIISLFELEHAPHGLGVRDDLSPKFITSHGVAELRIPRFIFQRLQNAHNPQMLVVAVSIDATGDSKAIGTKRHEFLAPITNGHACWQACVEAALRRSSAALSRPALRDIST